jgi:uncharacterized protein Usg
MFPKVKLKTRMMDGYGLTFGKRFLKMPSYSEIRETDLRSEAEVHSNANTGKILYDESKRKPAPYRRK